MNYREESFRKKFLGASQWLCAKPDQLVSLKLRENVSSYEEYRNLVRSLEHEAGLKCTAIDADLQGRGYLVGDGKTKLIVVEHETGLEILYIAGSIASLIGLVPLVLQGWHALRGRHWGRHELEIHGVEIRRMDEKGHLHEEHLHRPGLGSTMALSVFTQALATTSDLIESETKSLSRQVQSLTSRVDALEKRISSGARRTTLKTAKSTTNRTDGQKARKQGYKQTGTER